MAPAQEHMFDEEPLLQAVVLDCDFVINVLHENEDFHEECARFAGRLFDEGAGIVYSNLVVHLGVVKRDTHVALR